MTTDECHYCGTEHEIVPTPFPEDGLTCPLSKRISKQMPGALIGEVILPDDWTPEGQIANLFVAIGRLRDEQSNETST